MSLPSERTLLVERRGAVAIVTLNRPEAINAINDSIRAAFPAVLRELEADSEIRAIVLAGAGERGFCSGADIKEERAAGSPVEERHRLMPRTWIETLDEICKPTLAAIHGICMGGGLELALACDLRLAARGAVFALPETSLGLLPGGGGTQRLPRLIGLGRALDLLLTGERIDAEEAWRIGLVTRLSETASSVLGDAVRLAELIAARPTTAIAYVKEAARAGLEAHPAVGMRLEKALFALLTSSADRTEKLAAFRHKRSGEVSRS